MLELIERELRACDARLELGGDPPTDPRAVWIELEQDWRLVALFEQAPDDSEDVRQRLTVIAESFASTFEQARDRAPRLEAPEGRAVARELTEVLDLLVERTGADAAVVVDVDSPVVWGRSQRAEWVDDAEALALLGELAAAMPGHHDWAPILRGEIKTVPDPMSHALDRSSRARLARLASAFDERTHERRRLVLAAGVAAARSGSEASLHHGADTGWVVRPFASIYRLVVAFCGSFSELHAEATTARALPIVERLVGDLPPIDPPPTREGARVMPFRRS